MADKEVFAKGLGTIQLRAAACIEPTLNPQTCGVESIYNPFTSGASGLEMVSTM